MHMMDANSTDQISISNSKEGQDESLSDPFAVDLFAAHRQPSSSNLTASGASESNELEEQSAHSAVRWNSRLPRLSLNQVRLSSAVTSVSSSLSAHAFETIARVFARYTNVSPDDVSLAALDLREAELATVVQRLEAASCVWASVAVEPDGARIAIELDTNFAIEITNRTLGGDGTPPDELRPLSKTEQAIVEFLWLSLIRELNKELHKPVFRLESVTAKPPSWLDTQETDASTPYGLIATVSVGLKTTIGLARLCLTYNALASLSAARNPLLVQEQTRSWSDKVTHLKRIMPEVPLHLMIGKTDVEASELAHLEYGDVMLVEQAYVKWHEQSILGNLRLRVGDGEHVVITGSTETASRLDESEQGIKDQDLKSALINLTIESIIGGDVPPVTERLPMEDTEDEQRDEESTAEGVVALDGLMVTVHVELAARRISLDELARLRVGQILELECKATDPVDLIAADRRIARGELVDIEGRLGVRVTQVLR